jgi:hypothetical protein
MRKEYGKVLRQVVEQRMRASSFEWKLHREKSIHAIRGEQAFRKDINQHLALWCILVPNQKLDSFTTEIGWSKLGRYPQLSVRPSPEPHDQADGREEYLVRLGDLAYGRDYWWEIAPFQVPRDANDLMRMMQPISAELARSRVLPVVEDVLALLERNGEPYLERIAQQALAADASKASRG